MLYFCLLLMALADRKAEGFPEEKTVLFLSVKETQNLPDVCENDKRGENRIIRRRFFMEKEDLTQK